MIPALLVGLVGGLVSGLFGVGGGLVIVPLLVLVLGLTQHHAHSTSLAAVSIMAAAGAVVFAVGGSALPLAAVGLTVGGIAGAFAGSAVMHRLSDARLGQAFAALLLIVAVWMVLDPGGGAGSALGDQSLPDGLADAARRLGAYGATGLVAGVTSSVFGVGGGIIMVPALTLVLGVPQHAAEGTSLMAIVPISLVGALRQHRHGYTNWRLGLTLGVAGALAGAAGASVALQLPEAVLQRLFAALLAISAIRLLYLKVRAYQAAQ